MRPTVPIQVWGRRILCAFLHLPPRYRVAGVIGNNRGALTATQDAATVEPAAAAAGAAVR